MSQIILSSVLKPTRTCSTCLPCQHLSLCLQVLVEQVTGAVDMTFFHAPLINAYQNLSNVMLRIQPRGWQSAVNDTLLLNAHYDSPIGSTGEQPTAQSLSNCLVKLFERCHHCGPCYQATNHISACQIDGAWQQTLVRQRLLEWFAIGSSQPAGDWMQRTQPLPNLVHRYKHFLQTSCTGRLSSLCSNKALKQRQENHLCRQLSL